MRIIWSGVEPAARQAVSEQLKKVALQHGLGGNWQVEISLIGRKKMSQLNQRFRGQERATDVLSFPLSRELDPEGVWRLGDIVINRDYKEQLLELSVHGFLHLIGVHHQ